MPFAVCVSTRSKTTVNFFKFSPLPPPQKKVCSSAPGPQYLFARRVTNQNRADEIVAYIATNGI